jgi:ATP/ADP translocase
MVPTFFAFLNDSVEGDQAKRLYGLVGFGGVAGGAVGAISLRALISSVSPDIWMLLLIGVMLVIVILLCLLRAGFRKNNPTNPMRTSTSRQTAQPTIPSAIVAIVISTKSDDDYDFRFR